MTVDQGIEIMGCLAVIITIYYILGIASFLKVWPVKLREWVKKYVNKTNDI